MWNEPGTWFTFNCLDFDKQTFKKQIYIQFLFFLKKKNKYYYRLNTIGKGKGFPGGSNGS